MVQYLDYLAQDDKLVMLVVAMCVYDLVLGSPWFHNSNADIDLAHHRLTSLPSPRASGVEEMTAMAMAVSSKASETQYDMFNNQYLWRGVDIPTFGATTLDNSLGSDEAVAVFAL